MKKILIALILLTTATFMLSFYVNDAPRHLMDTDPIGKKFPRLEGNSISEKKMVFPDDVQGKITVLVLVFKRRSQRLVDTWTDYVLKELESSVSYYEIPMISAFYAPFGNYIDQSLMRPGIPQEMQDYVVTFYGNRRPYFETLHMQNKQSCYVFILDEQGIIRFKTEGKITEASKNAFKKALDRLQK